MKQGVLHQGLTSQEVEESRLKHGANILTPPKKTPLWKQFLEKFEDPIIRILLFAWVLAMIISCVHCWGDDQGIEAFIEPVGIFFAIILASGIGFIFEVKAAKAFEVLNQVNDDIPVTVIRNGHVTETTRADIVVGDIVKLGTGDEIPADGVLYESVSLQVNESTLTGEPIISKTTIESDFDSEATYPSNHVMRGTTVVDGHGIMQVTSVGDATEYGKVNQGAQMDNNLDTPLQLQLKRLAGIISKAGYTIAILTFLVLTVKVVLQAGNVDTFYYVEHILNNFMIAVTLVVVSVPEGLPMSVTLSLALSMNRMLAANNLVRKMHACETMGATTVICTDKTGTLTQNQMRVNTTSFFSLKEQKLADDRNSRLIQEGIAVNSTANLEKQDSGNMKTLGNPTEAALLLWLDANGHNYEQLRSGAKVVSQLTFSTERKYMATVVDSPLLGEKVLYVKGAPEIVMNHCKQVATEDGFRQTEDMRKGIEELLLTYQNQAMRTLGFAYKIIAKGEDEAPYQDGRLALTDLTFLGVAAISDPVRADVPRAVGACRKAGIDVKIVTGDTPATAREIARQIGIWTENDTDHNIITGPGFEALPDDEAAQRVKSLKIMCRARPTDKQRLVQLLQAQDAVVAVTGDGTNDAPALKAAQVGLSMGDGTSVAKEASDITILDNSFSSIVQAVMWGRSLYKNIQRFLLFQLTINVVACAIVLLGSLLGTSSPLTITQMLWVNLIMDTFAAGALASLPPSWAVMNERPRKSGENGDFIINRNMAYGIFGTGILFTILLLGVLLCMRMDGNLSAGELSWFFTYFVMLQVWNMFNAKAFMTGKSAFAGMLNSQSFLWVILLIVMGQYVIVTFGGKMFNVVPMNLNAWMWAIGLSMPVLLLGEAYRLISSLTKKKK